MAAPVDAARNGTNVTTASTTWTITVGSPTVGTLLIVFVRFAADPGAVTFTGYTVLAGPDTSDATDDTTIVYYRWADGAEGASDTLSPTNSVKGCAICWQVTGADNPGHGAAFVPTVSTVAVGTTTANTANPTSVAPSGAPKDTLYLAMAAGDGESAYTGAPTNYSNLVTANSGTAGVVATNCFAGGATRGLTSSSSDDAGAFTHAAHSNGWSAYTVAVRNLQPVSKSGFGKENG